jgi:hypothetical protein
MAADMTEGWWKTAWPSTTRPKADDEMIKAIKAAKARERGLSVIDYRKALHEILDAIEKLRKEADKQFKTAPVDKRRATGSLDDLEKLIKGKLDRAKLDDKPVVVFKRPFGLTLKEEVSAFKDLISDLPRMDVELRLMQGVVLELRDKNAESSLNTALNREFDKAIAKTAAMYISYCGARKGMLTRDDRRSLTDTFDNIVSELGETLTAVPKEVLRQIGVDARAAREYQIEKGMRLTAGVVGTGLAAASLAMPGTLAFGIVALVRSVLSLAKEITLLFARLETKIKALRASLADVATIFADGAKTARKMSAGNKVNELVLSTFNSVVGVEVMPSIRKVKGDLKEIEGNLAALATRVQALQGGVAEVMDANAKFEKKMSDTYGEKWVDVLPDVKKGRKNLDAMVENAHAQAKRVVNGRAAVDELRRDVARLDDPGLTLERAQKGLDMIIAAVGAVGGVADVTIVGAGEASQSTGVIIALASVYTELGNQLKDYA